MIIILNYRSSLKSKANNLSFCKSKAYQDMKIVHRELYTNKFKVEMWEKLCKYKFDWN